MSLEKLESVLQDKSLLQEINASNVELFRKEIVPLIYERGENFPRVKSSQDWQSKRIYSEPPSQWVLGVWSGATYTALVSDNVPDRTIISSVSDKEATLTIKDSQYLNATLYVNDDDLIKLKENAKRIVLEAINGIM